MAVDTKAWMINSPGVKSRDSEIISPIAVEDITLAERTEPINTGKRDIMMSVMRSLSNLMIIGSS
jgi:hypothetical protein